jgi:triphosphatase
MIGRHGSQQISIPLVGQLEPGGRDVEPEKLVHLLVGHELPGLGGHHPIGHDFGTAFAIDVLGMTDETEEATDEPRLLQDLSLCRFFKGFAFIELPLRIRPVLMNRAMDQGDLEPSGSTADQQPAGGLYDFGGVIEFHSCSSASHCRHPTRWAAVRRAFPAFRLHQLYPGQMGREKEAIEVEWQFDALDLRPVERWLAALPGLSMEADDQWTITAMAHPPRRLIDSYLDTGDWRMARAGFVVRTRRRGRHDEINLKAARSAEAGNIQVLEATEELPDAGVAALEADGPVGRRIHAVAGQQPLRPVLQVRTRRTPFSLHIDGVEAAEIALDDTEIVVGNGQRPMQLRRVEVEVIPQWAEVVAPIVQQLQSACGLRPATLSKFEAGLLARGVVIPGPPDLGSTDIEPESTLGELAYAVLRRQLSELRAREPGTRLGEDPEELHDMRVATRRLRAALDLFVEVLPIRARNFRVELGWLADVLGAVRDLDVQLLAQAAMVEPGQHELWADLTALLHREREAVRADLLAALDSVRWERLKSGMAAMVQQGPNRRSTATRLPALAAVPDLIGSRHASVVKAARRAKRSGEAADFHRLRIRAKRLRYSLEFSSELYGGRTRRYTRQLAKLQNQLGLLQDAEVAANRLSDLAMTASLPASTIFVMGGVAEQHRWEVMRLLEQLPHEVSRARGPEWAEALTMMERGRDQALALIPPARRALRIVPEPLSAAHVAVDNSPSLGSFVVPEVVRAASGGGGESRA